jgi:hypothetical protein
VQNEIEEFLTEPMDHLNGTQRIILMAEGFDYEVMVAAEWLTETYDMDIRCYRLKLSAEADSKYLSCTCIYPPPEITDHSVKRGPKAYPPSITKWANWDKWNIFFP